MQRQNKEIGIFDAIYSLMEHEHRMRGAELSGQRVQALQAGNVEVFDQTSTEIASTDAKLLFILEKRRLQTVEFQEKGIEQPGLEMAAKLHEYMLTLSGGTLPKPSQVAVSETIGTPVSIPATVHSEQIVASNGHVQMDSTEMKPEAPDQTVVEPTLPTQQVTESDNKGESISEPSDPFLEFKSRIPEGFNWDISSRPLTKKLESGRFPIGIRAARVALASVKYDPDLERLNPKRPRAVQEAYSDGSNYAPIPLAAVESAITTFVSDFMQRKGKRLTDLPQEVQDTITRIKEDPILGDFARSAKGREKLLEYALYKLSLKEILAEGMPLADKEDATFKPAVERKVNEHQSKMPELAVQQKRTIEAYLKIFIQQGWPADIRRAVALEQYADQIPSTVKGRDMEREEIISNKMGAVARERSRAEKKLVEAVELDLKGVKLSKSIREVMSETAKLLGVDSVTLGEVLDLLNKRVTPDQLRQKKKQM